MQPHGKPGRRLFHATMVVDGGKVSAAPGALLLDGDTVLAAGSPQEVGPMADVAPERLDSSVLIPALVNAHAHLDLTHLGPRPYAGDFSAWLEGIRTARLSSTPYERQSGLERACALARLGGTGMVGDIAGGLSPEPAKAMSAWSLEGVSFIEVFGAGKRQEATQALAERFFDDHGEGIGPLRFGVQPHAPFSAGERIYRWAASSGRPLSTHLAESREEIEFTRHGTGPLAAFLRRVGVAMDEEPVGEHPVEAVARWTGGIPVLAAHVNYIDDMGLACLATSRFTVVYCPRASAYFGHAGHRYRDMLRIGIPVALGTDSMACLDTPDRISVLDEMCLLHRRDGVDGRTLLRMATVSGAKALGATAERVTFSPGGRIIGVLRLPVGNRWADTHGNNPLEAALSTHGDISWLAGPFPP